MFATHFDDFVHRHNDGEVDGCCDEQEVDDSCQQYAKGNFIAVECDLCELIKVWRTYKCRAEPHKHGVGQSGHDLGKGGTDNDCYGKVHHVALHQKVSKSF